MNVNLHIERLVLDGLSLPPEQERGLRAALQSRLADLIAMHGLHAGLRGGTAIDALQPPAMHLPLQPTGEGAGGAIARAVFASVGANSGEPS